MSGRLKVSDFYKEPTNNCAIEIPKLMQAFIVQECLFVVCAEYPSKLIQYSLKDTTILATIQLPHEDVLAVTMLKNMVAFAFKNKQDLWIFHERKVINLKSHFAPITALTVHEGAIITGSTDMTWRIWIPTKQGLQQNSKLHVISKHKAAITCFLSIDSFLLTGSKDKNLVVWRGTKVWAEKQFKGSIQLINECPESHQLVVFNSTGEISILNSHALAKQKKIVINRLITGVQAKQIISIHEIDDSFLQILSQQSMQVAEINIGSVMAKVQLKQQGKILGSRCIRRMTMLAVKGKGLVIIKF